MRNTLKDLKRRALERTEVRREYETLKEEFELRDEILRARAEAGLTQAELAVRIGITPSAWPAWRPRSERIPPPIAMLSCYASALGCRLRLVKQKGLATGSTRAREKSSRTG